MQAAQYIRFLPGIRRSRTRKWLRSSVARSPQRPQVSKFRDTKVRVREQRQRCNEDADPRQQSIAAGFPRGGVPLLKDLRRVKEHPVTKPPEETEVAAIGGADRLVAVLRVGSVALCPSNNRARSGLPPKKNRPDASAHARRYK